MQFDATFVREFTALLSWRRDVRRFRGDPLPPGALEELVALATLAPSVGYSQPSRFVRVQSTARRAAVIEDFDRSNAAAADEYDAERRARYVALKLAGLREAPEHLAVFTDTATRRGAGLGRLSMPEMLAYSTVIAVHTLWLAARARGIGAGWVSIVDPERITAILDTPPDWKLVAYLCIGYPVEEHLDPELARAEWETRDPGAATLYER